MCVVEAGSYDYRVRPEQAGPYRTGDPLSTFRIAAAVALATAALSTGAATASDVIGTPTFGAVGLVSGGPCVYVGAITIGNPLSSGTIVRTDSRTGVYTRCPY